ncbi:phage integrase family protein [Ruegeria lacuscaerulensis ITI-1157]|nr:phage integrase family protein [Ruegeria lacuscaerulensis ITI-1157]
MMRKRSDKYPGAKPYFDRHGNRRWRYRCKGFSAELGTDYGSDEFERRYQAALNHQKEKQANGAGRSVPGTFDDLVARFYQLKFPELEEITKRDYRAVIEPLRRQHGHKRVAGMRQRHVLEIKAQLSSTPAQANKTLKRLSQLMKLAVQLEWRSDNPVSGVEFYQTGSSGYHTWTEDEIARFYAKHERGSLAYLAMTLMLYTGASRKDAVALGRGNIRGGRLIYRRSKTRKNPNGIEVNIPVHPTLADALETVPEGAFTFLETNRKQARSPNGLGNDMREWCDKAGLPMCSSHGLRKAICRRIAEAGGTPFEIMSVSGHITLAMAQHYCEAFGRKNLADSAVHRLPHGPNGEQKLTNLDGGFVNHSRNQLKGNGK